MSVKNDYIDIKFIGSFPSSEKMPKHNKAEYAFIGRSNVGKSSLINYLSNRKGIAKISKKPGKTQMINLFDVESDYYLVDLPGYGYASIGKKQRASWKKMIYNYLEQRENLVNCFVLIDSRIPLQEIDRLFIEWVGKKGIPFALVFTKIDSIKPLDRKKNIKSIKDDLLKKWSELPPSFEVSSVKKVGGKELIKYIHILNETIK